MEAITPEIYLNTMLILFFFGGAMALIGGIAYIIARRNGNGSKTATK